MLSCLLSAGAHGWNTKEFSGESSTFLHGAFYQLRLFPEIGAVLNGTDNDPGVLLVKPFVNCLEIGAVIRDENASGFDSQLDDLIIRIAVAVL